MATEPKPRSPRKLAKPKPQEDAKPLRAATLPPLSPLGSAMAPIVYFDAAPNFGFNNGIANITLEALIHVHDGEKVSTSRQVVLHLRANANGLASLKSAIQGIEFLVKPSDESPIN